MKTVAPVTVARQSKKYLPPEIADHAARGWKLFPLSRPEDASFPENRRGKAPPHGFTEWPTRATSDPAQLQAWAREYPGCNWAIATGTPSDLVVVDVDGEEGRASRAALEQQGFIFPHTLTAQTGRADGVEHGYYKPPPDVEIGNNNTGKLAPHIDVRGSGGYVVAVSSTHASGRQYRWSDPDAPLATLPDWIADRLRQPVAPPSSSAPDAGTKKVSAGGRTNHLVSLAGTMHKRGMSLGAITAALLAENETRCDPPLPDQKVREIARSIVERYPAGAPGEAVNGPADPMQAAILGQRPMVRLPGDNHLLSQTATELGNCLSDKLIFLLNDRLVTLDDKRLRTVSTQTFRTLVERYVVGYRKRKSGDNTYVVGATMTDNEASGIMASPQFIEGIRHLRRFNLCRQPVLRSDGKLELLPEGYDPSTQTLTVSTASFADDVAIADAIATIEDLLGEFVFADVARSKAVAVSALVGLFAAQLLPEGSLRPCFIVDKNAEGAGASTLVGCAIVPVVGEIPTGIKSDDDDEVRKSLTAVVREGRTVVLFDNQRSRLSSAALEAFLSSPTWRDRLLGVNQTFTGANIATVFTTANGCKLSPDMRRRSLIIELHLEAERAEDRCFQRPLNLATLLVLRPKILAACWALVRHWYAEGQPSPSRSHSAFPAWAQVVGGIVQAAGYACPLDTAEVAVAADEDGDSMRLLVEAMVSGRFYTFGEIVQLCRVTDCFTGLISDEDIGKASRAALSRILSRYDKRLIKHYRFLIEGKGHKRTYRVTSTATDARTPADSGEDWWGRVEDGVRQ
jgi:hypothetical protein